MNTMDKSIPTVGMRKKGGVLILLLPSFKAFEGQYQKSFVTQKYLFVYMINIKSFYMGKICTQGMQVQE